MKKVTCYSVFVGAAVFLAACAPVQPAATTTEAVPATAVPAAEVAATEEPMEEVVAEEAMEAGTIVDIAAGNPDFSTLVTAVTEAGLVDVLADPEAQWTVFAPTNAAFDALPEGVLEMVLADQELLTRILTYHVVQGAVTSDQLSSMMAPTMEMTAVGADLLGGELDVQVTDAGVTVNGATVVTADIIASNGVIHVIDAVLLPADVEAMVSGMSMEPVMTEEPMAEEAMEAGTIVDIAAGNPDFSTLVTAVTEAGLVDVLADPEAQWTVFAPTNAAFDALPEGVLEMVLADQELLTRILTYHVVQGAVTSDQLSSMMAPTMEMTAVGADLLGSELDVQVTDAGVTVNGANVVTADIIASNGVIHVIDAVLLPADVEAMVNE